MILVTGKTNIKGWKKLSLMISGRGSILKLYTHIANIRKAVFLVRDKLSWNVFSQTGSVETYLLMKELESQDQQQSQDPFASSPEPISTDDLNP